MAGKPFLATPTATTRILRKHDLHTQKRYGQNFLIDAHVPEKIVAAAQITAEDYILEIGPGIGTLTQFLAERAGAVTAVEVDERLLPVLRETLQDFPNAQILHADILKLNLAQLLSEEAKGRSVKVVANLPYYITTPILFAMLEARLPVSSYTLMVQTEVAERMQAGPGSKEYGALSLAVQYYTTPQTVMQVSPACFLPRPSVGSTVIQLRVHDRAREAGEQQLFRVIRGAFGQRRKTLVNALCNSSELPYSRPEIETAIAARGFRPDVRGEALSLAEFQALTKELEQGASKSHGY